MAVSILKVGILKLGCIGATPLIDFILDERAERNDIAIRAFSCGAKMDIDSCIGITNALIADAPNLVIVVSPNAALAGPTKSREMLSETSIPTISISDNPSKKAFYKKDDKGKRVKNIIPNQGFIILTADPMIGARKEFLDPTEMVLFNAEILKVLSITGYIRLLQNSIGEVIDSLKAKKPPEMPMLTASAEKAIEEAQFVNSYARAKAYAALKMAESAAKITTQACFKESESEKYIPLVTAGHELVRAAAKLADEAREIEKQNDTVTRTPHDSDGKRLKKKHLFGKPK